jgi:hypothetical protein
MKQSLFEQRHSAEWKRFGKRLEQLESGKREESSRAEDFSSAYRSLCQQLALAQDRGYSSHLIDQLQQLAMRGHQQFYRHRSHLGTRMLGFLLAGFPRLVREEWRVIALASLLFYGSLLLMGGLVYGFPDLVYSVLSAERVTEMESMYTPDATRLGPLSERGASDNWQMFAYYIMNNIGIAFQTFASGLLFCLGSLFFLLLRLIHHQRLGGEHHAGNRGRVHHRRPGHLHRVDDSLLDQIAVLPSRGIQPLGNPLAT